MRQFKSDPGHIEGHIVLKSSVPNFLEVEDDTSPVVDYREVVEEHWHTPKITLVPVYRDTKIICSCYTVSWLVMTPAEYADFEGRFR
jgi:hypothetical protein